MTPRRWLLVASSVAFLYAGQLISAYARGGSPILPAQIDRIILTIVAIGFILAGGSDLAMRSERRITAQMDIQHAELMARHAELMAGQEELKALLAQHAEQVAQVVDLLRQIDASTATRADHPVGYARGYADGLAQQQALGELDEELRRLTGDGS